MTTTAFKHSPLDPADPRAIQILELLPSCTLKGPIRCELRHSSLDEDIRYDAVSYTWGDAEPGHTILVNGSHTLDVTPNCLEALTSLRQRFLRRSLWIDAICIDQREDDASKRERDRQVKIMGDIYHKAQKVLIWLGPAEPSTARTVARLKLIAKVKAVRRVMNIESSALSTVEEHLSKSMGEASFAPSSRWHYQAFASMLCSPWWSRVWTLQEQVLARQCEAYQGRQSIPIVFLHAGKLATTVESLAWRDMYYIHEVRHDIQRFCRLYHSFERGPSDLHVFPLNSDSTAKNLLEVAFLLETKHPLDKIYGLYSILTTYANLPLPAPDYDKTAEDVFEEVTLVWVRTRRDLSILKLAARPGLVHGLPSWVPGWHQQHPRFIRNIGNAPERRRTLGLHHSIFDWYYPNRTEPLISESSSGPFRQNEDPAPIASVPSPGRLCIPHVRFVGTISYAIGPGACSDYMSMGAADSRHVHLNWCRLVHNLFRHSITAHEEALQEMFRSVWEPGIHQIVSHGQSQDELFESFRAWFDFMIHLNEASGFSVSKSPEVADANHSREPGLQLYHDVYWARDEEEAANSLESRYGWNLKDGEGPIKLARQIRLAAGSLSLVRNHSLCILNNDNMIAITDYWCEEGDGVFVFPGTDTPFVVRKVPDGDGYRLIGPALVDRLLRVGYQKWRSEGDDLQDIVLI